MLPQVSLVSFRPTTVNPSLDLGIAKSSACLCLTRSLPIPLHNRGVSRLKYLLLRVSFANHFVNTPTSHLIISSKRASSRNATCHLWHNKGRKISKTCGWIKEHKPLKNCLYRPIDKPGKPNLAPVTDNLLDFFTSCTQNEVYCSPQANLQCFHRFRSSPQPIESQPDFMEQVKGGSLS